MAGTATRRHPVHNHVSLWNLYSFRTGTSFSTVYISFHFDKGANIDVSCAPIIIL